MCGRIWSGSTTARLTSCGCTSTASKPGPRPSPLLGRPPVRWSLVGASTTGGPVDFLDGRIDEVRTYGRALTSNEIAELYNGISVPDQFLVYLMAYFTANSGILERVYYAYSVDALAWNNINGARPLSNAYDDSVRVRDPYIFKVNGKFRMVHTAGRDFKYLFHRECNDGITWSGANGQRNRAAGQINVVPAGNTAPNAWAPEFYWDGEKFYLFWTSRHWDLDGDGRATGDEQRQKLLYVTTTDWLSFSEPRLLFDPGFGAIDLNVISEGGTVCRHCQGRGRCATRTVTTSWPKETRSRRSAGSTIS